MKMNFTPTIQTRSQKSRLNNTNKYNNMSLSENVVENLKQEILQLQVQNLKLNQQLKQITDTNQELTTINKDKYLQDYNLAPFFKSFSKEVSLFRNDVIFLEPSLSQILKSGSLYQVTETLTSLSYDKANYSFICLNNGTVKSSIQEKPDFVENSSHWSLIVHSKGEKTVFHMDSAKGLNHNAAKQIIQNIGWTNHKFIEVPTVQQLNDFECGLHVLTNCRYILSYFLKKGTAAISLHEFLMKGNSKHSFSHENSKCEYTESTSQEIEKCVINELLINKNYEPTEEKWRTVKDKVKFKKKQSEHFIECKNKYQALTIQDKIEKCNNNSYCEIENQFDTNTNSTTKIKNTKTISKLNVHASINKDKPQIKLVTDSHGRFLNNSLYGKFADKYKIQTFLKPNAKLHHILSSAETESKELDNDDFLIIIGGTNDIDDSTVNINTMCEYTFETISKLKNTNVIISAIPQRYDYPYCNKKIRATNRILQRMAYEHPHVSFVQLDQLHMKHYTKHGLHLNQLGKKEYASLLANNINLIKEPILNTIPVRITNRNSSYHSLESHFLGKGQLMKIKKYW